MADDPRRHVAAVGAAHHTQPSRVDEVELLHGGRDARHHVLIVDGSPTGPDPAGRAADRPSPIFRIARRTAWIAVHDRVSGTRVDLELVEEPVPVLLARPAVDVQHGRIFRPGAAIAAIAAIAAVAAVAG